MNKHSHLPSRRNFIQKAGILAAGTGLGAFSPAAASYARIFGANDRINIAAIGCFRRFNALMESLPQLSSHLNLVAVCDADKNRLDEARARVKEKMGVAPRAEVDLRKVISQPDVDAVLVSNPDHWHAATAIWSMKAGKHVYVEKPCAHNPLEGEWLTLSQAKYNRVVQMGTQQRSAPESMEILSEIHGGLIGETYSATAFYSNSRGRVPVPVKADPPASLNWELFQGPAPREPYMDVYFDYNWHWFWQYGTAETGNNAVHELDICRWALKQDFPVSTTVTAGKYHFADDGWQMYDTMDAVFRFADGKTIRWDGKSRNNYQTYGTDRGSIIYGSDGSVFINRNGYKVFDRSGKLIRERQAAEISQTTQLGGAGSMDGLHILNFVEAIRGKTAQHMPIAEGAKSTLLGHLANIAFRVNKPIHTDPVNGHILDNDQAASLWSREYEKGWEPLA